MIPMMPFLECEECEIYKSADKEKIIEAQKWERQYTLILGTEIEIEL